MKTEEEIKEKLGTIEEQRAKINNDLTTEAATLSTKIEVIEKEKEQIVKEQKLTKEKQQQQLQTIKDTFKELTNRDMTDKELNDYLIKKEEHNINLFKYIENIKNNANFNKNKE